MEVYMVQNQALPPLRSYLYVPGSNPHMIEKALTTEADAIILDLEDAVALNRKAEAREYVAQVLQVEHEKPIFVRINALSSGLADLDIAAVASPWLAGLSLPKTGAPEEVRYVAAQLERLGCQAGIHCLLESALGVEQAFAIARAHPRVVSIGLGEADLRADLSVSDDTGLSYARSRIVVAARAAKLPPPIQSVYPHIRDAGGLRQSTEQGRRLGFFGRAAIHPQQVPIINAIFTPTEAEIAEARALVEKLEQASAAGTGAFALPDGRFVDLAIVESARRTLLLAEK
jgi:citrate lyase subunit beta/citryl-CoA lyase